MGRVCAGVSRRLRPSGGRPGGAAGYPRAARRRRQAVRGKRHRAAKRGWSAAAGTGRRKLGFVGSQRRLPAFSRPVRAAAGARRRPVAAAAGVRHPHAADSCVSPGPAARSDAAGRAAARSMAGGARLRPGARCTGRSTPPPTNMCQRRCGARTRMRRWPTRRSSSVSAGLRKTGANSRGRGGGIGRRTDCGWPRAASRGRARASRGGTRSGTPRR